MVRAFRRQSKDIRSLSRFDNSIKFYVTLIVLPMVHDRTAHTANQEDLFHRAYTAYGCKELSILRLKPNSAAKSSSHINLS